MHDAILIQHSSDPADPDGPQRRYAILQRNLELLEHQAVQHQGEDFAFILIDLTREGKEMPDMLKDSSVTAFVQRSDSSDCIPTQILGLPRWQAYKSLRMIQRRLHRSNSSYPKVSPVIERLNEPMPADHFAVVVISGGKQAVTLPIPKQT